MLLVVLGITYGTFFGLLSNYLLFRRLKENQSAGVDPLRGIGQVFFLRYIIDACALFLFGLITRDAWAIVSAGLSLTMVVKISLLIVYTRKGGRFE
jgi:hypothetical protein